MDSHIVNNINEMLKTRKIDINITNVTSFQKNQIIEYNKIVLFCINQNLSIQKARIVVDYIEGKNIETVMIFVNGTITSQARQLLQNDLIQIFTIDFFLYNPLLSVYSPKYRILTKKETKELSEKINVNHIPKILTSDVIARYLGVKPKQILEILRSNNNIYYRRVTQS